VKKAALSSGCKPHPATEAHDLEGADALLPQMEADTVLADKAFDADERVIEPLLAAGKTAVIPAQEQPQDPALFRQRPVQSPPSHREFHLQAQAIPSNRYPLR
jgi:hypothetical protein